MYPTLGFSIWHTLYTVYARFKFQGAIGIFGVNVKHNFFIATCGTFGTVNQFGAPALLFAITDIHAVKVTSKQGGLVATCTATYLYNGVTAVFRVFRY